MIDIKILSPRSLLIALFFSGSAAGADEIKPVLYFDLGNVVVDTRDWNNVRYVPGAHDYLNDLRIKGYRTNLMVNFVDKLGNESYKNCEEKFAGVVRFLRSKWKDSIPFAWEQYDGIILPQTDQHRKPRPNMFVNALASSCPAPVLYQTEDDKEVTASRFLGLGYWQTQLNLNIGMLPEAEIQEQVARTARFSYPDGCEVVQPDRCELSGADMARIISGMSLEPIPPIDTHPIPPGASPIGSSEW